MGLLFGFLESGSGPYLKILEIISIKQKMFFLVDFDHFRLLFDSETYKAHFKKSAIFDFENPDSCSNRHKKWKKSTKLIFCT